MIYDVFISYRREGGYETAKHLYDLLTHDGYNVSFDIDTLRSGDFDTELLKRIDGCKDFLLIVSKNAFERTLDKTYPKNKDWLRCELSYALTKNKNIIPVFLTGVNGFPDNLPEDISKVISKNGPLYNRYYFDDFYRRLKRDFILSKPTISHNFKAYYGIILFIITLLALIILAIHKNYNTKVLNEKHETSKIEMRNKGSFFSNDFNDVEIGDYIYEDGTFSHEPSEDKPIVGIVFSLSPTAIERNNGWTHGLAVASEDCGHGKYYSWSSSQDALPYPHMIVEFSNIKLGLKDKQGYIYTYKGATNSSSYQAFCAARNHKPRIKNGSGWYLPTIGQWADILKNLGGVDVSTLNGIDYDSETAFNNLKSYGFSNDYYWTATENYESGAWVIYLGQGDIDSYTNKTNKCKVRAICSF